MGGAKIRNGTATGTIDLTGWKEATVSEVDGGPKLTDVSSMSAYAGDFRGEGKLRYTLYYDAGDGSTGLFTGLEQVTGSLSGRAGSFVLRHDGTFGQEGTMVKYDITVVPKSGTGELTGLRGSGSVIANHGEPTPYTLDYEVG